MTDDVPESTAGDLRDVLAMGATQSAARLAPGQVIDAYRVEEEIATGGMGRVYRAHDQRLGRDVALKLHVRARAGDELVREASALARLAHPNVVTVYEVGTWAGHPWVAMELVRGGTARAWRKAKPRTPDDILSLYRAAGTGLAAAHSAGLVHRDFKPDNVLVGEDGRARVADFGLAIDQTDVPELDATPGTPGYMAPEQRSGGAVDARADQYAFAVSLWEALAERHPFVAGTATTKRGAVPALPSGNIPRRIETALRRAMDDDPEHRWPSMAALLAAIAPPRSRAWMIAGGGAALGLGAVAIVLATRGDAAASIDCTTTAGAIDRDWSSSTRSAIRAQFGAGADLVLATTDAWVGRWRAGSQAACEATHVTQTQSPALYDQRMACLERGRTSLRAMVALFEQTKLPATKALDVATALPHIEECGDVAMLVGGAAPPVDLVGAVTTARADALIAKTRALRSAGDINSALEAGRAAVEFADGNKLPSASGRARIELAAAIHASGTLDGVRATFEEAVKFAASAHDDTLAARAWINMINAIAILHLKPEDAEQLVLVADAAVVRAGSPPLLVGLLAGSRGDIAIVQERYSDAVPLIEQLIAAVAAAYGPDDVDLPRWRNRLAVALFQLQRFDEARIQLTRAAEVLERHYGSTHKNLGIVLTTRGQLESSAGNYGVAVEQYQRALAIKTAAVGPEHASIAPTLISLALAQADAGATPDALVNATRGTAIAERTLPPMHPNLGLALQLRGRLETETGAWAAAEVTLNRAIEILSNAGASSAINHALAARAVVHLRAGRKLEARADATRAVEGAERVRDKLELAKALVALAVVDAADHKLPEARAGYLRASELVRAHAGPNHPSVKLFADSAARL